MQHFLDLFIYIAFIYIHKTGGNLGDQCLKSDLGFIFFQPLYIGSVNKIGQPQKYDKDTDTGQMAGTAHLGVQIWHLAPYP